MLSCTILGSELHQEDKVEVLRACINRFTGDWHPTWVTRSENTHKLQFKDDEDWLSNTYFSVRKDGRLDRRAKHCQSFPTWPNGT